MRLIHIELLTTRLDEVASFYGTTLGLPVERDERSARVEAGATTIAFRDADAVTGPFYHFAINITPTKMAGARAWLAARCPLLRDSETGEEQLHFEAWNADAIYCHDPAGNIVELIARHGLASEPAGGEVFGPADLLSVSEIGLPLRDPARSVPQLVETLGLPPYLGASFALGDGEGLLILPEEGRSWLPQRTRAATGFPVSVVLRGGKRGQLTIDGHYHLRAH